MIEFIAQDYLKKHISVSVFQEKPKEKLESYVVIDKTGSSKSNHLPEATIAFQSYAESKYQAAVLNKQLKNVVEQMIELDEIRGLTLNGDYYFPDTATKQYRYQAVYDIRYY